LKSVVSRTAVAVFCALFFVAGLPGSPADADTHHHRHHHHHKHSAAYRAHQRHLHQLRMHRKMVRRLHRSMPNGVGFHRFYDRRTHSVVHVAAIRPGARVRLRPVPASVALHKGRLVRTSRMCKRVHCILAVNGSFRDLPTRLPRGAEVVNGVPLKLEAHQPRQAVFSQRRPVALGGMHTEIRLHQDGVGSVTIHSVNMRPGPQGAALFTRHYGPRTPHGLTARIDLGRFAHLRLGRSYRVDINGVQRHSSRSLRNRHHEVTLVARGQSAWKMRWFARHVDYLSTITLSTTSPAPAPQSIGTSFRLLHNYREVAPRKHWHLIRGREPRTVLATRPNGTVLLITIDGRRRKSWGTSMQGAAYLSRRLGASEAVNLDGGGSTTFVVRGHVLNNPSDGYERGVVNALVLVRAGHRYDPHYLQRLRERRAAERRAEELALRDIVDKVIAEKQAKLLRISASVDER
jgi:hypothetical protein